MSTRYVTDQQFSDGTTIDGNRIESALQSLESISDKVPHGAVRTRFTQSHVVSGWSPVLDTANPRQNPFMDIINGSGTGEDKNIYRFKGTADNSEYPDLIACETSSLMDHPAVLHSVSCIMQQSENFGTPYQLPGGTGNPYNPPAVDNIEIHVSVDAEYVPSDRTQSDMEIHKHLFDSESWRITSKSSGAPPLTEMRPAYPGGNMTGWAIELKDLNIPVRAFAVIRIALLIPSASSGSADWGTTPWRGFSPTLTATFLEPNRDA